MLNPESIRRDFTNLSSTVESFFSDMERRISKMEQEVKSVHMFLDEAEIGERYEEWKNWNTIGKRMNTMRESRMKFENISDEKGV